MSKKIDASKLQGFFAKLMEADPANKLCADCHTKNPRWASTNLGVFLCIKCAGIHRSIGTHITKVKSITLDGWEESQLAVMKRVGNSAAARVWEHNMPESVSRERPTDAASSAVLERWIRNKYERKLYFNQEAYNALYGASGDAPADSKPQESAPRSASAAVAPPQNTRSNMPRRPSGGNKQDLFDFGTTPQSQQPPQTRAPASQPAGATSTQPTASLDDIFGGFSSSSSSGSSVAPQTAGTSGGYGGMPQQQQKPQQSNADIMALFGSTPASTQMTLVPTPMQPENAGAKSGVGSGTAQVAQPRQGNYNVDMRAYGVYRHPACVQQQQQMPMQQQMTPQQMAYYQQMQRQQQMMMDPTQRTYNLNYQRFA